MANSCDFCYYNLDINFNWNRNAGFVLMKQLYDVQQLLKRFNIYVYVGKRKWDIELMALELDNIYHSGLITQKEFISAKVVLQHEYEIEKRKEEQRG